MTRQRLIAWLIAVALACLGGGLIALVVTWTLHRWLNAWDDSTRALLTAVAYVTWVGAGAAISAFWLRRTARP